MVKIGYETYACVHLLKGAAEGTVGKVICAETLMHVGHMRFPSVAKGHCTAYMALQCEVSSMTASTVVSISSNILSSHQDISNRTGILIHVGISLCPWIRSTHICLRFDETGENGRYTKIDRQIDKCYNAHGMKAQTPERESSFPAMIFVGVSPRPIFMYRSLSTKPPRACE
jgi:hypothetical protein